jgi:hypothetical protein
MLFTLVVMGLGALSSGVLMVWAATVAFRRRREGTV